MKAVYGPDAVGETVRELVEYKGYRIVFLSNNKALVYFVGCVNDSVYITDALTSNQLQDIWNNYSKNAKRRLEIETQIAKLEKELASL